MIGKRYDHGQKRTARVLTSIAVACVLAALAVVPSFAATARATTMKLEKTEGTATLKTQNGTVRKISNGMHLYSGNTLATAASSYAYVSLDGTKAVKLGQNSSTTVRQSGKQLELLVKSGQLFFNVSEKLTQKESLNIRTSSMVAGIRGTCGVVEKVNSSKSKLYLIEGQVTLGNGENAVTVQGGQTATVILRPKDETGASGGSGDSGNTEKDMEQKVYVEKLTETNVPIFAITEILSDPVLQRKIEATTELKIKKLEEVLEESQNPEGTEEEKEEEQKPEETTSSGGSYGGSSGGGSTGEESSDPQPIETETTLSGSDVTVEKINEAFTTGDYDTVTLTADVNEDSIESEIGIDSVEIPKNKKLVVGSNLMLYADTITVGTGGALVIDEGGLLNNRGTLTNNGTFENSGTFENGGTITNSETGTFTNSGTLDNTGTINNSGSITNDGTITDTGEGIILETGSTLTNNNKITGNITLSDQSELINNQNCTITGGITLGSGSTLTNSGKITGSGDPVISLNGGKLILGETGGSSNGSIENTGTGYTIAVAENPKSTITWNDTSIIIYSSSDLDHAIQGLTKEDDFVVPANLEFSPQQGLAWDEDLKTLRFQL